MYCVGVMLIENLKNLSIGAWLESFILYVSV